jgi:hypothetical protein
MPRQLLLARFLIRLAPMRLLPLPALTQLLLARRFICLTSVKLEQVSMI